MGAFDDLIPAEQAPASSGAFDDLIPSSVVDAEPVKRQTRRGIRSERQAQSENIYEGLPQETIEMIESENPLKEGRVRGGNVGVKQARRRAAELERIRAINPSLASLIEETGDIDAFLIGAGRGLTAIPRAVGFMEEDETTKEAIEGLRTQTDALSAGEVVGESAPFAAIGGPTVGLAKTGLQKKLATSVLGGAEGATITAAEGGDAKDIAIGTAVGGLTGFLPAVGGDDIGRATGEARKLALKEGRELLKEPSKREINRAVSEATPSVDQLKTASRNIYSNLEEAGASISQDSFNGLDREILRDAVDIGMRPRLRDQVFGDVQRVIDDVRLGDSVSVKDLEDIRKQAKDSASAAFRAGKNQEGSILDSVADNIDNFMSNISTRNLSGDITDAGAELSAARRLWGSARKQELLDEAYRSGQSRAAGAERGIRNDFNSILNNKKKSRFFSRPELDAIRQVVDGTPTANTFRRLGQMGFGRGQQTNVLGGTASAGAGSFILDSIFPGGGAVIGAILFPTIGTISKTLAERITRNSARMAGQVVRAGSDAENIAQVYLRNTPKAQRSPEELAQLLMRPDVNMDLLRETEFTAQVIPLVQRMRESTRQAAAATTATAAAVPAAAEEE